MLLLWSAAALECCWAGFLVPEGRAGALKWCTGVMELWRLMLTGGGRRNLGSQKLVDSHPSSRVVPWSAGTLACWCPVVLVPWLECKYPGVLDLSLGAHWRRGVNSLLPKSALRGEEVVPARAGFQG